MIRVIRIDTAELIGYLVAFRGSYTRGAKACMFNACRHPDGRLRHEPDRDGGGTCTRLSIPLGRRHNSELELMVPPDYLDFIREHPSFHPLALAPATH
jgi:hypothetical protein